MRISASVFALSARALPAAIAAVLAVGGLALTACGEERPVYGANPFARDPAGHGPLGGKILTSNAGDDTLSILDPNTPAPPGRVLVGFNPVEVESPHHLAADPAGRFIYVNLTMAGFAAGLGPHGLHGSSEQAGFVVKLDAVTGREVARAKVDPNPGDSTLSLDGRTLYVTHYDEIRWRRGGPPSNLIAIDTDQMVVTQRRPLCPAAHGVRLSADGLTLYATCGPDHMAVVDVRDSVTPPRLVPLPNGGAIDSAVCARCPYGLAVAPDGTVWLSALGPNAGTAGGRGSVEVYDPSLDGGTFDLDRRILLRGRPVFATFASDGMATGYRVLIPEQINPGDSILVYSSGAPGMAPQRISDIPLDPLQCLNAHMMLVDAGGQRGQLICEGDQRGPGSFVWFDLQAGAVTAATPIGVFPDGLVLVPPVPPAASLSSGILLP